MWASETSETTCRYRATVTKAEAAPGKRFLITGIGGGVALFCLQFAVALGVEVWVTSSSPDKLRRAVQLGAAGGVSYRDKDWKAQLQQAVPDGFDAVVDGEPPRASWRAWWRPRRRSGCPSHRLFVTHARRPIVCRCQRCRRGW